MFVISFFSDDIDMVECGNIHCQSGRWFHLQCTDLNAMPGQTEEWFCSELCEKSGGSAWCLCRRKRTEKLIECHAQDACCRGRFFHPSCVGYVPALAQKSKLTDLLFLQTNVLQQSFTRLCVQFIILTDLKLAVSLLSLHQSLQYIRQNR